MTRRDRALVFLLPAKGHRSLRTWPGRAPMTWRGRDGGRAAAQRGDIVPVHVAAPGGAEGPVRPGAAAVRGRGPGRRDGTAIDGSPVSGNAALSSNVTAHKLDQMIADLEQRIRAGRGRAAGQAPDAGPAGRLGRSCPRRRTTTTARACRAAGWAGPWRPGWRSWRGCGTPGRCWRNGPRLPDRRRPRPSAWRTRPPLPRPGPRMPPVPPPSRRRRHARPAPRRQRPGGRTGAAPGPPGRRPPARSRAAGPGRPGPRARGQGHGESGSFPGHRLGHRP